MKKLFIILWGLTSVYFGFGEISDDINKVYDEAKETNISLQYTIMDTQTAKDSIPNFWKIDETRISINGGYTFFQQEQRPSEQSQSPESASVAVTVPLFTQLELSASYKLNGDAEAGISYSPFNSDLKSISAHENYEKSLIRLNYEQVSLKTQVEDIILDYNASLRNRNYLKDLYNLKLIQSNTTSELYKAGIISYDEYIQKQQEVLKTRQNYLESESKLIKTYQNSLSTMGPGLDLNNVPAIEETALWPYIHKSDISQYQNKTPQSQNLENLEIELKALEQELEATPLIQPELNLSSTYGLTNGELNLKASISLESSQIKFHERKQLESKILLKKQEIALEEYSLQQEIQLSEKSIQTIKQGLDSVELDLKNAETSLTETTYLNTLGQRTTLEVKQAELNLEAIELQYFQSLMSLYQSMRNHSHYYL